MLPQTSDGTSGIPIHTDTLTQNRLVVLHYLHLFITLGEDPFFRVSYEYVRRSMTKGKNRLTLPLLGIPLEPLIQNLYRPENSRTHGPSDVIQVGWMYKWTGHTYVLSLYLKIT